MTSHRRTTERPSPGHRRHRAARPLCESLEGRSLMTGFPGHAPAPIADLSFPPPPPPPFRVANDYDGDGKADQAVFLPDSGTFAVRPSNGGADVLQGFGPTGPRVAKLAPGDYDGDGKTDLAVYLPATSTLYYRPSYRPAGPTSDVAVQFGPASGPRPSLGTYAGDRASPAPGDYDGDGRADVAVYVNATGTFAIRPSSGAPNYYAPFGAPGLGASLPAPGDYDGDGKTDLAVYMFERGELAYRPSAGGADVIVQFGSPGFGGSTPATGDYDGDGKADIAVYLPAEGAFAVRPSRGGPSYYIPFGTASESTPTPGDYDGDGKTDASVFIPRSATSAFRPSKGGADVVGQFGIRGIDRTQPAAAAQVPNGPYSIAAGQASGGSGVVFALTDGILPATSSAAKKKNA